MYPYKIVPLPYALTTLEPYIDSRTLEFHYGKHYAGYVENFNRVLAPETILHKYTLEQLLGDVNLMGSAVRQKVINFGGGVYNHELFWQTLGKASDQKPEGKLAEALVRDFGSFEKFQEQLTKVSASWFGSGWGWLCIDKAEKLVVLGTSNQDCPISSGLYPLLAIDVWEHAYYLQYQNRRAEFIAACWHVINWRAVEQRLVKYCSPY